MNVQPAVVENIIAPINVGQSSEENSIEQKTEDRSETPNNQIQINENQITENDEPEAPKFLEKNLDEVVVGKPEDAQDNN